MAKRNYSAYLTDVLEYCDRIIASTNEMTLEEFRNDLNMQDAFARRFEIIGEAVKRIPDSIRDAYPDVEWRRATSFRDVLAHDYVDIEIDLLYLTAKNDLPTFRAHIARVLSDLHKEQ